MVVFDVPTVTLKNRVKLCISKAPGLQTWILFWGLVGFGLLAVSYCAGYLFVQLLIIIGSLMISPAVLGKWEDCVIDRRRNQVSLTRCNWYHRVCCSVPEENTTIIPLNNVIGVRVSDKNALELLMLSGKGVPITSHITDER